MPLTEAQKFDRDRLLWQHLRDGKSLYECAVLLTNAGYPTSKAHAQRLRIKHEQAILDEIKAEAHAIKARHIDRYRAAQAELWLAWERSKQPRAKQKQRSQAIQGGGGANSGPSAVVSTENTVEGQTGNPAYLIAMFRSMEQEAALMGIASPIKVAETNVDGSPIDPETATARQARLAELVATALARRQQATGGEAQGPPTEG